jgi:hypothetical protein
MRKFSIFVCLWAMCWATTVTGYVLYQDQNKTVFDQQAREAELGLRVIEIQNRVRCSGT